MRLFQKLFLFFFVLLFVLLSTITAVQYRRERDLKASKFDLQLQKYNSIVDNFIRKEENNLYKIDEVVNILPEIVLRTTIIDSTGNVLYDSDVPDARFLDNHIHRPEFQKAKTSKTGKAVRRSATTGIEYYYVASNFGDYLIRTAKPYNLELRTYLKTNYFFLYFIIIIFIITTIVLFFATKNATKSIDRLRIFTEKAKNGEELLEVKFPNDELGEISSNMVMLYKQLATANNQVSNSQEKLIKHLQISQEGLGIFSKDKKEILTNPTFIQYTSFLLDKHEATSDEIFDLDEFKGVNKFIDKSTDKQLSRKRLNINKYGRYFFVQCVVFHDKTFEISINDITTQEYENEFKRELTQNISHELKTPVSTIMGYMESILENPDLESKRQHFFIKRSYQQALRLSSLLHDISTLNKLDEKRKIYQKEEVNVTDVLQDVLQDVKLALEQRNMTVNQNLNKNLIIKGNSSLLYSIFRNLIDNTISYAGENVHIEITNYREDERFYYFTFSDNGIGVSQEHLKRLFERFYRVDKGRSRKMGGTGLGLAIVKNAIQYHKGKISVKETLGGGLTFVFSLKK